MSMDNAESNTDNVEEEALNVAGDELKIFVSRIPLHFDEEAIQRILEEALGPETVANVNLAYEKTEQGEEGKAPDRFERPNKKKKVEKVDHLRYGFATLNSVELVKQAIDLNCIRGGPKLTSTKKHTLYIGPCFTDDQKEDTATLKVCFPWTKNRCPYGDSCKFSHDGPGGALEKAPKKPQKCRDHRKGKCKKGDDCSFSHDFEVKTIIFQKRPDSEKDCINWKQKGKCRKRETCPFKHDPAKIKKKNKNKEKQPIMVRVFGLNYETKEPDIRNLFEGCGPIVSVDFPTFSDSGRGKGYCGVTFQSPKAVEKAVLLDKTELQGRWLSVQAGKMYLEDWEKHHSNRTEPKRPREEY